MTIGDEIVYRDKRYTVRGFAPLGVRSDRVELEDHRTGDWISVPLTDLAQTLAHAAAVPRSVETSLRASV
jgi:hypothetical protein